MLNRSASLGAILLASLFAQGCSPFGCSFCMYEPQKLAREDLSRVFKIDSGLSAQIRGQILVMIEIQALHDRVERRLHEACEGLLKALNETAHGAVAFESCSLAREAIVRTRKQLGAGVSILVQTPPLLCASPVESTERRFRDCFETLTREGQSSCKEYQCPHDDLENTCRMLATLQTLNLAPCPARRVSVTLQGADRPTAVEARLQLALQTHLSDLIELAEARRSTEMMRWQTSFFFDSSRTRYRDLYEDSSKAVGLKICLGSQGGKVHQSLSNLAALTRVAEEIVQVVLGVNTEPLPDPRTAPPSP